jgi:hypothetical protein
LQSCRPVVAAVVEITFNHLTRACDLEQIDELGLGPTERSTQIVASGSNRLNVIASCLAALPVVAEVRPFLIGPVIVKDDQGRRR